MIFNSLHVGLQEADPSPKSRARDDKRIVLLLIALLWALAGCSRRPDPDTLVMIIENSPTNLDPRVGIDAQSERIDELIFDSLVRRDEHFNLVPWLAERWEIPDPLTYVFHLHGGVKFHDGHPLTSRDVKYTLDSLAQSKIRSPKSATYQYIDHVEAPDDKTVVIHLKEPDAALLWNLSDGAFGVVPYGADNTFNRHPVGSGPFRFVSAEEDKDVVIKRNDDYWAEKPKLERVRFAVIPDITTRALELRKGSADVAINALTSDMYRTLKSDPSVKELQGEGTIVQYLAMNMRDPVLQDVRVRQALAYAIDRRPLIDYLWRDTVRPADSLLPPQQWAYNGNVTNYNYDPAKANAILDAAGYARKNGVRFHLAFKTSTEESTRLLAAVLQQQLREVGIALDIRSFEFATFLADVQNGGFQLFSLRLIGGNQDPDIFEDVFATTSFSPKRLNRTHYSNPQLDELLAEGRKETDQQKRKAIYAKVQQILSTDLPFINLWYFDNVIVYTPRVKGLTLNPSGNYDFLRTASLQRDK